MSKTFESLKQALKKLPSMGAKSAERSAIHLSIDSPKDAEALIDILKESLERITPCPKCFGISEKNELCIICSNKNRDDSILCVVENAGDIFAIEKSGAWNGKYHVLGGKLSPIKNIFPQHLRLDELKVRIEKDSVRELILALSNDIEGEATCHYISEKIIAGKSIKLTRIGFGLPSGSQLGFADPNTIKSAINSRKDF